MASLLLYLQAVISLSVVGLVSLWTWYHWTHRRRLALARKLPLSLPALPLIGHLHYILHARNTIKVKEADVLVKLLTARTDSGVSCLWVGPTPYVVINHPDIAQKVLNHSKALNKPWEFKLLHELFGDGLISAPEHIWRKSRRQLNHVFNPRNVQLLVPEFNEESVRLVQSMSKLVRGGHQDILPQMTTFSFTNILRIMFGKDVHFDPDSEQLKEAADNILRFVDSVTERFWTLWLWWDVTFRLIKRDVLDRADFTWNSFLKIQMNQAFEKRKQVGNEAEEPLKDEPPKNTDNSKGELLTVVDAFLTLRQLGSSFGEIYLRKESQSTVAAGIDTTTVTLSTCLVLLGNYPEIQERLYQEVVEVAGTSSRHVTLEDINRMTYMDQVLKETMRRFCIVPITGRASSKDIELGDCIIPANTPILISFASLNSNPDFFPEPFKFDPDRFLAKNVADSKKNTFLPFSAGARDCIGKHYAMMVMKTALVHILRQFKIHSDVDINNMNFKFRISIISVDGYHIQLKNRGS